MTPNLTYQINPLQKFRNTTVPPNGVTARFVSRTIRRSFDNRASTSRGTALSVASELISLLSQNDIRSSAAKFGIQV
jgi:hypothetical protein